MGVGRVLPEGFNDLASGGNRDTAGATAVREFFPILLILVAVDVSVDGKLLKSYTMIAGLDNAVPAEIYVYAFLGAGAYAVTSLAFNPKQSLVETYRLTYRLIGALPLAAGIYILSEVFMQNSSGIEVPVAGLAFLSGRTFG